MESATGQRWGFGDRRQRCSKAAAAAWLRAASGACVLVLAGCGGGRDGGAAADSAAPQAAPTIGVAGGTVSEADGAQVVAPAGALQAPTTVRIAKDSTSAPALPALMTPVGSTYALTPHGTRFDKPVVVRVPMPATPPQANQVFKLAKAELNGTWAVLWDSKVEDGMLTTEMYEFSFVIPVAIPYAIAPATAVPLSIVSAVLECGGQDCGAAVGPVDVAYRVSLNGGQLPSYCAPGTAEAVMDSNTDWWWRPNAPVKVPLTGGTLRRTVSEGPNGVQVFWLQATCKSLDGLTTWAVATTPQSTYVRWAPRPTYPGIGVLRMPATLELVDGTLATVDALLNGGGARPTSATPLAAPTFADRAVVEWQRSDDDGRSWRVVALSYQNEADPLPLGGSTAWRYWSVRHGFRAQAADHGALLRVRACYTPPEGAAPPCAVGPSTRLVVPQGTAAPAIMQAPRSMLVRTGQTASFSAAATGTPAPTLQWQTRAANTTGAWVDVSTGSGGNSGNFTTAVLTLADNGAQFRVIARNAVGSSESVPVTVSVSDLDVAPTLTSQPAGLSVVSGSDAALAVSARGTEALGYQWRLNGTAIAGANAPLLRLSAVDSSKAGIYTVTVSNTAGSVTSNAATLTVTPGVAAAVAPSIVNQPVSVLVNAGNTATFAVGAAGTGPLSYQWLRSGQPIAGATAAFYSLATAAVGDAGTYSVAVSNAAGQATSFNVTLTVNATAQPTAVTFSTQPAAQVQPAGGSALFAVAANGSGPLSYQWRKDGQPINGQTGPVLSIAALNGSDAGVYSVTVANALGSVNSSDATLTLLGTPTIATQPQAQTQLVGSTATFSVAASGQGLRYMWLRNGTPVPGATTAQLTTPALTLADNGAVYSVIVFNSAGLAVSNLAVLTVNSSDVAASITQQPAAQSGVVGGSVTFTVGTAGTPTPNVAWQTLDANNNWAGNGVTGNSFTLNNLTLLQNGMQVRAIVSNAIAVVGGSQGITVTSNAATLSVVPVLPANALTATQVVAHADRSLVVRPDGSVWAFGKYTDAVTGGFPNTNAPVRPVRVAGLPDAQQVAVGSYANSWALGRNGTVWGWGFINSVKGFGQGPSNGQVTFASPVQVLSAAATPIDRVCNIAGSQYGVVMVRSDVQGGTCAASEPRSVWFTGDSMATGQVGGSYATPLASLAGNGAGLPTGRWIVEVITSRDLYSIDNVFFARANDGTVYAWGLNGSGQLGTGDTQRRTEPTAVAGWQGATRIAVGGNGTLALMPNGSIKGAGNNNGGNLGIDTTSADVLTPAVLAAPTGASDVSSSFNYANTMALVGGRLFYWGSGGRFSNSAQFTPIPINSPATPLTAVSVASYHALAIGPGNAVYAWGNYEARGCGNYDSVNCADTQTPTLVTVP